MHLNLNKDLMVSLWSQYQAFKENEPVYGGDFVIVDNELFEDFAVFKINGESFDYCVIEAVEILRYWNRSNKNI